VTKQQRAAIETVARHFSATWEKGDGPPDAWLTIAGREVAVEVTTLRQRSADNDKKPRLRFDGVALGLVRRLQAALSRSVPDGRALIVTITAPIKVPTKTAAELEISIRADLARRLEAARHTIHGNQIRVRLVKGRAHRSPNVIGFVHNPDSDAEALLDIVHSLIESIGTRAPPVFAGDRWLVLASDGRLANIDAYRLVYARLSLPADFDKILVVGADGRVETLAG
jgi:hypothetical protein